MRRMWILEGKAAYRLYTSMKTFLLFRLCRKADVYKRQATGYESNAIAAAVIGGASFSGGRGTVVGALIGALIISVLNNGFTLLGLNSFVQQIAIGIVVVLAVFADILQRAKVH